MWGFQTENGGGNLYAPAAALYSVNTKNWNSWTLTPAGKAWQDQLGIQDWDGNSSNGWTTQLSTAADASGLINFNGYYGDYQLTIGGNTYPLSFVKGTSRYTIGPMLGAVSAIPEPSTACLLLICGTLGRVRFRRR
jgi:hypothetical protein